jgi:Putative transposase
VRIEAANRAGRERLLRYCARPPFALDRLRELDPKRLLYESMKPGPGGNGPLLLTPLELLDRLAALVPPSRMHRHRYFGVLVLMVAHWKFPGRPGTAEGGRFQPVEGKVDLTLVVRSTAGGLSDGVVAGRFQRHSADASTGRRRLHCWFQARRAGPDDSQRA